MRRTLIFILALAGVGAAPLAAAAALPVVLRQNVADEDGRVTLGELFDGAGAAGAVVVATMKPGSGVVLDAAAIQRIALANGLSWSNETGLRRIIVRSGAAVAAVPSGSVEALTYTRSLAAGEAVGPADLAWTKVAVAPPNAPRDAAALIGMAAKRPLRAGSMVTSNDVSPPQVIRKDDIIAVSYSAGGISLTLQAKALQGAAAGETFNVVNPASKKIIQALAVGPAQAVVGPQATQYRAASSPAAYASLR